MKAAAILLLLFSTNRSGLEGCYQEIKPPARTIIIENNAIQFNGYIYLIRRVGVYTVGKTMTYFITTEPGVLWTIKVANGYYLFTVYDRTTGGKVAELTTIRR